jgi:histone H3/H4
MMYKYVMRKTPKIPYAPLRRLLKKVLDESYDGCQDSCICCGSINNDVCEFVDRYIKKPSKTKRIRP